MKYNVKLYFDGAKNPVCTDCSYVLLWQGKVKREIVNLSIDKTNNQAEYLGLINGLKAIKYPSETDLEILGDSQLVVMQVNGRWACRNEGLRPLLRQTLELLNQFEIWKIQWIPREENIADKNWTGGK